MMLPPPTPTDLYEQGLFRLAGFGGALVLLRSGVTPAGLSLDIGFLSPDEYVWFLRRPVTEGFSDQLATMFFDCANEAQPERVVPPLRDGRSGLLVQVLSSDDSRVEMQFQVLDGSADEDEADGLNFETSRVALVQAATEARVLEDVGRRDW